MRVDAPTSAPGTLLRSVQRAAQVLRVLARERRPLSTRELSRLLGLNRSTTYHLVNTLVHEGLVRRDGRGRLLLGGAISELYDGLAGTLLPDARLLEAVDVLNERTGETSYVGVWDGYDVVTVAVREGFRGVRVRSVTLGYRDHVHARALGRALLAHRDSAFVAELLQREPLEALTPSTRTDPDELLEALAEVRRSGVAVESEEFAAGVCCAGAPVFGEAGDAVAALSVSVPKARFEAEGGIIVETVKEVALMTTTALAGSAGAGGRA